jgi:Lrp/AsnC family leucine-responsive transcriptional regulator
MDDIDNQIIGLLVRNGRAPYAEVGQAVGLSPHAAAERVRKLVRRGVITGFTVSVDLASVGNVLDAYIDVRLAPGTMPDQFERRATELPQVRELAFVTGRFDYQLRVICQDADDLDQILRALRQKAGAVHTETRIVLRATPLGR